MFTHDILSCGKKHALQTIFCSDYFELFDSIASRLCEIRRGLVGRGYAQRMSPCNSLATIGKGAETPIGRPVEPSANGSDLVGKASGGRKLIAIVHADMVGYGRLIGLDDAGTLGRLRALRRALIDPSIRDHGGKLVKTAGDLLLVVFESIEGAVRAAVQIQQNLPAHDGDQLPDRRIRFRVGINIGDVIADDMDVHGDSVNVAARLQAECPPGGVCVSRAVRDHVRAQLDLTFEELGSLALKNIARPIEAFVLRLDPATTVARPPRPSARLRPLMLACVAAGVVALGVGGAWWLWVRAPTPSPATATLVPPVIGLAHAPPLSLVVLPFSNLSGDQAQDYLVDGITEDLTTDLSQVQGTLVIARNSAFTYKGSAQDVKQIGEELGVRYVVKGSVRPRSGSSLRVNADLVSTETGANLWADRFDIDLANPNVGQDEIVARIGRALNAQLVDIESARAVRERPTHPQAFDLILQARALTNLPPSPQRLAAALGYDDQALKTDPSSVPAMLGIADTLTRQMITYQGVWISGTDLDRAASLIAAARALVPNSEGVMVSDARLLEAKERWPELMPVAQRLVEAFPNRVDGYDLLASAYRFMGLQDDALPLYRKAMRLDPRDPNVFDRYGHYGFSLLASGRYGDAIAAFERSIPANPEAPKGVLSARHRNLGAAYALNGQLDKARLEISESRAAVAVRHCADERAVRVGEVPAFAAQIERVEGALRLAGQRDHADEDADFGVPPDDLLHAEIAGYTPTTAPGAVTIRTAAVPDLLAARHPLVIDTMASWWGRSIRGAIGLKYVGLGGSFSDPNAGKTAQEAGRPVQRRPV